MLQLVEGRGDIRSLLVRGGKDQCVEHTHRRRERVHERDHFVAHQQRAGGHLIHRRHLAVGHADDGRAPILGILHRLECQLGVAREADGDDHIAGAHAEELVEGAGSAALHLRHIVVDQAEIEIEIARQERRGTEAHDVDMLRLRDDVHHMAELRAVGLVHRHTDLFHIALEHVRHQVAAAQLPLRRLDALDARELAADHLLQSSLHTRVAVVAELRRKTHHGRLAHLHGLAELAGRHERRLVVILQYKTGNELLPLGKAAHVLLDGM